MFSKPPGKVRTSGQRKVRPKTPKSRGGSRPGSAVSRGGFPADDESGEDELEMEVLRKSIIALRTQILENEAELAEIKARPGIADALARLPAASALAADKKFARRPRKLGVAGGGGSGGGGDSSSDDECVVRVPTRPEVEEAVDDVADGGREPRRRRSPSPVRRRSPSPPVRAEPEEAWRPAPGRRPETFAPPPRRPRERTEPRYGSRGGRRPASGDDDARSPGRPRPRSGWADPGVAESKGAY